MDENSRISIAVLVWSITLSCIPITAQQNAEPLRGEQPISNQNRNPQQAEPSTGPSKVIAPQPPANAAQGNAGPSDQNLAIQRDIAEASAATARYTKDLADYTWLLVIVAAVVGIAQAFLFWFQSLSTEKAANAAQLNADAALLAQRAYVDMSHRPPGLTIDGAHGIADSVEIGHDVSVEIEVKNYGKTPADVTSVVLALIAARGPLPDSPPYKVVRHESGTFLMPERSVFITPNIQPLSHTAYEEVRAGKSLLYLMGYVEYRDAFGHQYRSGYARYYVENRVNNLSYVTKRGYNYDIEIDENGNPQSQKGQKASS